MEFLKRGWVQTRVVMEQMTPARKWLIIALLIILALSAFIVLQYAGSPEMVPISKFATDRQGDVLNRLQASGIRAKANGPQILVPSEQQFDAIQVLQMADLLAEDTSSAFDDLVRQQSPWTSNAQNARNYLLAKRQVLGKVIAKMKDVRSADVMLDIPEDKGFGNLYVRPSASVNVIMSGNRRVNRQITEAIAGLVSGAIAELRPQDVVVIDANIGRQWTVKSADEIAPNETFELVQAREHHFRDKIERALSYIPGVIVAVNVRTDAVLRKDVEQFEYEKTEPLKMQESEERERKSVQDSGEAGVRPNTGLSIAGSRPAGDTETYNRTRSEFSPKSITSRAQIREVGQGTKQVNVTVNVPRSYFVGLLRQSADSGAGGAGATTPGNEQIEAAAAKELANIVKQVEPLVNAEAEGVVRAHMIPDIDVLLAMMGKGGEQKAGMGSMFSSPTAHTIGLATLALVSIGLMFGMVRKALHQPVLPTVEELAGVPPNLPGEDDLVGEVEESDAPMSGVEVDDNEVRARKIAEQISEMIKANPTEAVGLFKRWVDNED